MFDARSNTPMSGFFRPGKVNGIIFTFRPFFIISLALLFLFNALGGDILVGEVWAARSTTGLTSVGLDSTGSPSPLKSLSAATFTLPPELGYVQESTEIPDSDRTVIHIQDAHCNYAAQRSIAEILNYLTTEYGIYAVNCEGGAESYDLSPFTVIPEEDIREKTADYFVKEGVVSAAEYYAVNNPEKVSLWGVEDPDLYIKDLKIFRDSLAHKKEIDRYTKSIGHILNNIKPHIYSAELLEFDKYYTGYKDGKITFKEYILYLISMAQKRMIGIKSFSNMYLLSQTLEEEEKINFKRANNEKDEVVEKLKKSLSRNELEELMAMVGRLKSERISQADFYAYLAKKAKSVRLDISVYNELQKYIVYISLYNAIDRSKVAGEIDALEYRIKTSLYQNDTQRELGVLSKNLAIMKNMFNVSLTRDDYSYYEKHRDTFAVANYISFIDKKAPLYKITAVLDKNIGSLDEYRERMDQFYRVSLERDKAFIKNIKFTDHDRPNSIIITGGFHTENLRELFKDEKVSYISIMPKFKNEKGYKSPYMERLAGQRTPLENVIDTAIPAVLNLQVVEILSKLADMVEGKLKVETFKRIQVPMIAALMRGKSFILKVDRGIPVKDAKPEEERFITFPRGEGADIVGTPTVSATISPNKKVDALLVRAASGDLEFETIEYPTQDSASEPPFVAVLPGTTPSPSQEPASGKEDIPPSLMNKLGKGGETYTEALEPAMIGVKYLRQGATRIIAPINNYGDRAFAESLKPIIREKLSEDVHLETYLADEKSDWSEGFYKLLQSELTRFVQEDIGGNKFAPRMLVSVKTEPGKDIYQDTINFINEQLLDLLKDKPDAADKARAIFEENVRVIQVTAKGGQYFNISLDFFRDMDMLEIDRYLNGAYGESDEQRTPPSNLQNSFIRLFNLSVENTNDFESYRTAEEILKAIFSGKTMEAKAVDYRSFDEYRQANRALMQSV